MKKINWIFVLIFAVVVVNVSCQSEKNQNEKDDFNITIAELKSNMQTDSSLIILDVRTPGELVGQHGKINGVINIPVQELSKRVAELEKYKKNSIVVICRSGNRSITATNIMKKNGFNAKNVLGGMKAYNKSKRSKN